MARIARIMVPTDFSPPADGALDYARDLASQLGASIDLVHVLDDPFTSGAFVSEGAMVIPGELRDTMENFAREQLEARHTAHAGALPGSSTAILLGPQAKSLVKRANEDKADLIVMGTHGRTGLEHLLLGSVAEKVVRTAACPVLTTRQAAGE